MAWNNLFTPSTPLAPIYPYDSLFAPPRTAVQVANRENVQHKLPETGQNVRFASPKRLVSVPNDMMRDNVQQTSVPAVQPVSLTDAQLAYGTVADVQPFSLSLNAQQGPVQAHRTANNWDTIPSKGAGPTFSEVLDVLTSPQGWKFMSCSHCQELCQRVSWLLIGCTRVNNQSEAISAS